jgi:hypothetical protein
MHFDFIILDLGRGWRDQRRKQKWWQTLGNGHAVFQMFELYYALILNCVGKRSYNCVVPNLYFPSSLFILVLLLFSCSLVCNNEYVISLNCDQTKHFYRTASGRNWGVAIMLDRMNGVENYLISRNTRKMLAFFPYGRKKLKTIGAELNYEPALAAYAHHLIRTKIYLKKYDFHLVRG